jgi:hypothetical protein
MLKPDEMLKEKLRQRGNNQPAKQSPTAGGDRGLANITFTLIQPTRRQPRPADGIVRRSFPVGRYKVTITIDLDMALPGARGQVNIQWSPDVPSPGTLSKAALAQYVAGRNAVQQEVADITGGNILVADI